jgi:hypothetical protein
VVEQVLLVTYTLVLPSDETSKYFISLKNRAKTKRFELWFVSGPTLKKSFLSSCTVQQKDFVVRSKKSSTFRFFPPLQSTAFSVQPAAPPPKSAAK